MKLFGTKVDNNIPKNYKLNTIAGLFDDKFIKYDTEGYVTSTKTIKTSNTLKALHQSARHDKKS